jgi:hypothetical protein
MPTNLTITVTVTGSSGNYQVSVSPNKLQVDQDGVFDIVWQAGSGSVPFVFDSTSPINFVGNHTPLTTPQYQSSNNTVTCTDTVSSDGDYPYTVTLWVGDQKITFPSVRHVGNGDPEIHNHPQ